MLFSVVPNRTFRKLKITRNEIDFGLRFDELFERRIDYGSDGITSGWS
jgi:hypothetical protein